MIEDTGQEGEPEPEHLHTQFADHIHHGEGIPAWGHFHEPGHEHKST